jgi:RimJ/RimL family protein N-acetyltransferase
MTVILETDRLLLRHFCEDDAPVVLELLNDPAFVRFVGDRGVRTLDDARRYVERRLVSSYERNGFGLYLAVRKDDGAPIGMCGLVKREGLADVDLGFTLLPAYRSRGYAFECASAVIEFARCDFGLTRIVAIVDPGNADSIRVLERLGMTFERTVRLHDEAPDISLYALTRA